MAESKQIKIATYNIQFAFNLEKVIDNIKKLVDDGVSFICIQEVINKENEPFFIDSILKHLGKEWRANYNVGSEISKISIGTAIIWNSTIATLNREEKILLPKIPRFDIHENIYYRVIGVPPVPLQRKAITCYFAVNDTQIRITCVHLDNVGGPRHRLKQLSYLVSTLHSLPQVPHDIVCGDFNTFDLLRIGYEKKLLQRIFGKEYVDASKNVDWSSDIAMIDFTTSWGLFPWFIKTFKIHIRSRLDYIWVKNFDVLHCQKKEFYGSDHFPIIATLSVPEAK